MMSRRRVDELISTMESMSMLENVAFMCPVPRLIQAVNGSPGDVVTSERGLQEN